jgi:hypothetical protein
MLDSFRSRRECGSLVNFIAQFPAEIIARARRTSQDAFVATVDCGPDTHVSDADAPHYGATAQEACEKVKAWLLDDIACEGKLGKPQYQPHWHGYDIEYRLGSHWRSKHLVLSRLNEQDNGPQVF